MYFISLARLRDRSDWFSFYFFSMPFKVMMIVRQFVFLGIYEF